MQEFFDFLLKHWYLSGAFVAVLIALTFLEIRQKGSGSNKLGPSQLTQLINRQDPVIIDIRDREQYQQGHVVGAKQASVDELLEKGQKMQKKDQPLVLIDADGREAIKVMQQLVSKGNSNIFILSGGLAAWKEAGMPIVKAG